MVLQTVPDYMGSLPLLKRNAASRLVSPGFPSKAGRRLAWGDSAIACAHHLVPKLVPVIEARTLCCSLISFSKSSLERVVS